MGMWRVWRMGMWRLGGGFCRFGGLSGGFCRLRGLGGGFCRFCGLGGVVAARHVLW